ncbi:hypothetical protein S83_070440 [Arachis hypogaea]
MQSFKNPFSALLAVLFDNDAPLRRVCNTSDLHGTHGGIMHNNNEQPPNLNPNFTSKFQSPSVHPTPTNATIPPSLPQSTPHQSCCHRAEGPPTGGVVGFVWSFGHLISEASVVRVVCSSGKLLCQRLGISSLKVLSSGRLSCTGFFN